ncbi:transcriptional regulator [Bifidobacterium primatium]|uniref:Transcriptional regulator n=1 Tax=Bifidobacterium primatium TaxID=2045438 RepID=A0A2M9H7Y7_9BIFI|nr:helix-turn-helix transcriptional regulator [Bifidobacterium primatium]PJM72925.1 transcriptional regulator [Bifidobacterium primatium]
MGLKEVRSRKGLTQVQAAELMALPQQRISEYERGQDMNVSRAKKFATILGCSLDEVCEYIAPEK